MENKNYINKIFFVIILAFTMTLFVATVCRADSDNEEYIYEHHDIEENVVGENNQSNNNYVEYEFETGERSNTGYSDDITILSNDSRKIDIYLRLLNAPYDNDDYCEKMLNKNYIIRYEQSHLRCTNYPTNIVFGNGLLDANTHVYTKKAEIDFSSTNFSGLGDYYFDILQEGSDEVLYQIIISFRSENSDFATTDNIKSIIQIKSLLKNGEKVKEIDLNIENSNSFITIDKQKFNSNNIDKVSFDIFLNSYPNSKYTVLNGDDVDSYYNDPNQVSILALDECFVLRDANGDIIAQTYSLDDYGKLIIGKQIKISDGSEVIEIPSGTKYKIGYVTGTKYKEDVVDEDPDNNIIEIEEENDDNPKTGVYYNSIPFYFIFIFTAVGILAIVRMSVKNQ